MGRKSGWVNETVAQRRVDLEYCARELWLGRGEDLPSDLEIDAMVEHFGPLTQPELAWVLGARNVTSAQNEVERVCKKARQILRRHHGATLSDHEITYWTEKV